MTAKPDFCHIVREHGAMMTRIAASHEADAHLAEELVQDIMLALWKALPSFRGDSSLRTFVARVATNRAVSHVVRAMKNPQAFELDDETPSPHQTPETQVIEGDRRTKILAAVQRLPLASRQPVMLTLEGFTPAEIAETLGVTANTVSIRMARAKALLRALLGEINP